MKTFIKNNIGNLLFGLAVAGVTLLVVYSAGNPELMLTPIGNLK